MNIEKILSLAEEIKRNLSANVENAAEIVRLVSETPAPPPKPPTPPQPPEPPLPSGVLTKAVLIGNPGNEQYPGTAAKYCHARSISDLQVYLAPDGWRCLVGYGDFEKNIVGVTGKPIIVWSFARRGGSQFEFKQEITIGEEAVWEFVEYDGKVYIPGVDPVHSRDRQQGAVYINSNGVWTERETIKDAVHLYSLAVRDGNIYVLVNYATLRKPSSQILKSSDEGRSWARVKLDAADAVRAQYLVTLGDNVLIFGTVGGVNKLFLLDAQDRFQTLSVDPFSPLPDTRNNARYGVPFGEGMLYTSKGGFDYRARHLFYFDMQNGARLVADFKDRHEHVNDIVVRGETAYVLTVVRATDWPPEPPFTARIYAITGASLSSWRKVADVADFPGVPKSLEVMEGNIFIGLGNGLRGIPNRRPDSAYAASGDIHVLA